LLIYLFRKTIFKVEKAFHDGLINTNLPLVQVEVEINVSVIIPTYNRLWCLPRAIDSCRNSACNTEIIVVDDGSTDGTWEWLLTKPDIIAVRQENQGQTYAINNGFSVARGEFIRFLDSDDFLCAGTIDNQYQKAIANNAQLVCGRVDLCEESSKKITVCPDITEWTDFLEIQLSSRYGSHFLGMLFHRDLVEKTPRRPDFALREDRMFLLEVALLAPAVALTEGCAGYWVQHNQQMQGKYSGLQSQAANWQHLNIFRKILGQLDVMGRLEEKYKEEKYKKSSCIVLWQLAHWIAKDHIGSAVNVIDWIYEIDPDFIIPDKGFLGFLYRTVGFNTTERLLAIRRLFIHK
jgi:glycosyltransferase involved in cell wall biosynthesis